MFAAVLVASLVGSLHCVGMCGPLISLGGSRSLRLALVHALGRLTTYATLGLLAGALGRAIDLAGQFGDVQRAATLVAGGVILAWGIYQIAVAAGWRRARPGGGGALFQHGLVQIRGRKPALRTWLVGVLTGLLPCGWLWAFVVSAAGTGSPWTGAAVMGVFWLGTVPAMTGLLALAGPLLARARRRLPVLTAIALLGLGVGTLAMRWPKAGMHGAGMHGAATPSCHGAGATR